jgi:hypothetical protein
MQRLEVSGAVRHIYDIRRQCQYKTTAKFNTLYISVLQLLNNTRKAKQSTQMTVN